MKSKKGAVQSANGSAILIIIITVLIVLYILFLPPAERAELLGESTSSNSGSSGSTGGTETILASMTLFSENVGSLDYLDFEEREHTLSSFRISTQTSASTIKEVGSVYVKSSVFDSVIENITFSLDRDITENLKLTFNTGDSAYGRLIMVLNGEQIINDYYESRESEVVELPADILQRYNTLTIGVSSPGWAFWQTNEYSLNTLQIIGDITDLSGSESQQSYMVDDEELENLDRSILKFYADCASSTVGQITIKHNGDTVFRGLGDCGALNKIELDVYNTDVGENTIHFETTKGTYVVSDITVTNTFDEPLNPLYYFDLDERYFTTYVDDEPTCGEVDDYCPDDCSADEDKDCCFDNGDNYWCDYETDQFGDRCVTHVSESTCGRCESGYEDYKGRPAEDCEDQCGDDTDNYCPLGCSIYVDKDCCFEEDNDNYWCDDLPKGRSATAVCQSGVERDERNLCPEEYYDKDGDTLDHVSEYSTIDDEETELKDNYRTYLYLTFPNSDRKTLVLLVNGRQIGVDTADTEYRKEITDYVVPDSNSIEIEPQRDNMEITNLKVVIRRVSS